MKVVTNKSERNSTNKMRIKLNYKSEKGVFTGKILIRFGNCMEWEELKSIDDLNLHSVSCYRKGACIVLECGEKRIATTNTFSDGIQMIIKVMSKKYLDVANYFDMLDDDQTIGEGIAKGLNEIQTELQF